MEKTKIHTEWLQACYSNSLWPQFSEIKVLAIVAHFAASANCRTLRKIENIYYYINPSHILAPLSSTLKMKAAGRPETITTARHHSPKRPQAEISLIWKFCVSHLSSYSKIHCYIVYHLLQSDFLKCGKSSTTFRKIVLPSIFGIDEQAKQWTSNKGANSGTISSRLQGVTS